MRPEKLNPHMQTKAPNPFYIQCSQIIVGIIGFTYILYVGQDIIVPLVLAIIISILLNPLVNFLHHKGINRVVAISFAVIAAFLFIVGLVYFIASQAAMFTDALPQLKLKINLMFQDLVFWFSQNFNISTTKINNWIALQKSESLSNSTVVIGRTITTIGGMLVIVLLLPVYCFLFLYYKPLLIGFIDRLFPLNSHNTVVEVLSEIKALIQRYLIGLLIEAAIVTSLNTIGLLIIGIDYALLIGVIGALLNIVPYIGGLVAISIPFTLALITKEPIHALYVLGLYSFVQLVDNNFIVPKVVASKVKINALVSIVVVLIGGAIWGIAGMFLSLPLTAICKVIFDRLEPLKPLGFLLGDTMPEINLFKIKLKKK
jgi:predicted PurR-regulated permease PerM